MVVAHYIGAGNLFGNFSKGKFSFCLLFLWFIKRNIVFFDLLILEILVLNIVALIFKKKTAGDWLNLHNTPTLPTQIV